MLKNILIVSGLMVGAFHFAPSAALADQMCGSAPLSPCLSQPNQGMVISGISNLENGGDVLCKEAWLIVKRQGFDHVAAQSCNHETYVFTGYRGGHRYLVQTFSDGSIYSIDTLESHHKTPTTFNDQPFANPLGGQ